jgi:outer membrane protein
MYRRTEMKKFFIVGALLIGFFVSLPIIVANAAPLKIGIIDIQKIMRESKEAKKALAVFRIDLEEKRAILVTKEKEIRSMEQELKADTKMSPEVRREKGEKLARDVKELKRLGSDLEEELKKKDVELTQKLMGEIRQLVTNLFKKESYTIILEKSSVVMSDESIDITDRIIKLYDAQKK